jgi:hypothetical protein
VVSVDLVLVALDLRHRFWRAVLRLARRREAVAAEAYCWRKSRP